MSTTIDGSTSVMESASDSDRALLGRFVTSRDEAAFRTIVVRHGPMVMGVCQRILRRHHDAEDAFQSTFVVLARKAGAVRWHDSIGNWLYGTALRLALKANHRQQGRRETPLERDPVVTLPQNAGVETTGVLDEELGRLPRSYRAPLVLCYLQGMSQDEAARELGMTPAAIKGRLQRGRSRLRDRLMTRGVVLSAALAAISEGSASAAVPGALVASTTATAAKSAAAGLLSSVGLSTLQGKLTMFASTWVGKMVFVAAGAVALVGGAALVSGNGEEGVKSGLAVPGAGQAEVDSDVTALQGTWKVREGIDGGAPLPEALRSQMRAVFSEKEFRFGVDGKPANVSTFVVDSSAVPKQIDFKQIEPGRVASPGIYEIKDGTLTICISDGGGPRPTKFESQKGRLPKQLLVVLEREKDAQDDQSRIRGAWRVREGWERGHQIPAEVTSKVSVVITDTTFTVHIPGDTDDATYIMDPTRNPKHFDATRSGESMQPGIYEFDGKVLRICLGPQGGTRPEGFITEGPQGKQNTVFVLEPAKQRGDDLQGEWHIRQWYVGGKSELEESRQSPKVTITKDAIAIHDPGRDKPDIVKYALAEGDPKQITLQPGSDEQLAPGVQSMPGIYLLKDNTLTLCVGMRGPRPIEFKADDPQVLFWVLERIPAAK